MSVGKDKTSRERKIENFLEAAGAVVLWGAIIYFVAIVLMKLVNSIDKV